MELLPGEYVIKKNIMANLFKGIEAVGGFMQITNQRIVFKAHALNVQTGPVDIWIEDIVQMGKRNTLGLVPNGMRIIVANGTEYRFVVWKRGELMALIDEIKRDSMTR
ncbi:GRAM domain-containing protein [Paenibacillus sp. WLX2291]|uniref:GRAM domain-containing protein n=1 Tax=Paenibacillus sp. WLX2291 TaxID=3296934 RepID=UPI003983E037